MEAKVHSERTQRWQDGLEKVHYSDVFDATLICIIDEILRLRFYQLGKTAFDEYLPFDGNEIIG